MSTPSGRPVPVPDVRTLECPESPGTHELVTHEHQDRLVTTCRWCGRDWGELDTEVRIGIGRRAS